MRLLVGPEQAYVRVHRLTHFTFVHTIFGAGRMLIHVFIVWRTFSEIQTANAAHVDALIVIGLQMNGNRFRIVND